MLRHGQCMIVGTVPSLLLLRLLVMAAMMILMASETPSALVPVVAAWSKDPMPSFRYRPGQRQDAWSIGLSRLRNFQKNPFHIPTNNFLVAVIPATTSNNNKKKEDGDILVGWAEIQPLGLTTQQRSSKFYNARPGSYDIDDDVDDQLWEEFSEDDSIQVPTGWASLPWTKEYRAMEAGIVQRQDRRTRLLQEAQRQEQQTTTSQAPLWELCSVFVEPYYRGQGVGSELVRRICTEYKENGRKRLSDLYLITRHPTFFQSLGFEPISTPSDIPVSLKLSDDATCLRGVDDD